MKPIFEFLFDRSNYNKRKGEEREAQIEEQFDRLRKSFEEFTGSPPIDPYFSRADIDKLDSGGFSRTLLSGSIYEARSMANLPPHYKDLKEHKDRSEQGVQSHALNLSTTPALPSSQTIELGVDAASSEVIGYGDMDRRLGTYIIGSMGMGKSSLMLNLILQDIEREQGVVLIDPHGDLVKDVLSRTSIAPERLVLLDPTDWSHPFGLNLFECSDPSNPLVRTQAVSKIVDIIKKVWTQDSSNSWGARLEDLISHVASAFVQAQGYTLVDVPLFLENESFRAKVLAETDEQTRSYWKQNYDPRQDSLEFRTSTLTRIRRFTDNPVLSSILGQSKSTINFRQIIDEGKTLLAQLPDGLIGKEGASLIGMLIIDHLLQASLSRSAQEHAQRRPFSLYIDEFQLFATDDVSRFLTEGRKFAAQVVIAHQYRDQLDPSIRSATLNVSNKVVFRISSHDAQSLGSEFSVRTESNLPYVREVTSALLRTAHVDPTVSNLIESELRPLLAEISAIDFKKYRGHSDYNHYYEHYKCLDNNGLEKNLDKYLIGMMDRSISPGSSRELNELVSIYNMLSHIFGNHEPEIPGTISIPYTRDIRPSGMSIENYSDMMMDAEKKRKQYFAHERIALEGAQAQLSAYRNERTSVAQTCIRAMLDSPTLQADWSPIEKIHTSRGLACGGTDRLGHFMSQLALVARILHRAPLRVASALGADESSNGRSASTLLSSLPKYQARIKIQQNDRLVETTIKTLPPLSPLPPEVLARRLEQLTNYAHMTYTLPLENVKAQTTARQLIPQTTASEIEVSSAPAKKPKRRIKRSTDAE